MAFEVYKPRGERITKLPLVSFSKNSIVLSKVARHKLNTESVELAFDRDAKKIRIKASEEGQKVKKTKLFARGFFNNFDLNLKGKYKADYDENENALFVDLNQPSL